MSDWYKEQYSPKIDVKLRDEVAEFDKWINSGERSYDEIGKWGWSTVRSWMHWDGTYLLPTTELNDYLLNEFFPEDEWDDERISNEVVEICAGRGRLGRMLQITMTDSHIQEDNPEIKMYYLIFGQPTIKYPEDVIKCEANLVPRRFHPHTIIGSYVTWGSKDYNTTQLLGANYHGPDVIKLYKEVNRIILIGNETIKPHTTNPLLSYPHKEYTEIPGLITRSDPKYNRLWVWDQGKF